MAAVASMIERLNASCSGTCSSRAGSNSSSGATTAAFAGGGGEAHLHGLGPADEVRGPVVQVVGDELDVREPAQQLGEHDLQLEAGQRRAHAEVGTEAERQVRVRVAGDVEAIGVGEPR